MPFTTPLVANVDVGGHDNIIDTPTGLARYNMHLTSTGLQLTPRDKPAAATTGVPAVGATTPTTIPAAPTTTPPVASPLPSFDIGGMIQGLKSQWDALPQDDKFAFVGIGSLLLLTMMLTRQ